MRLQGTFAVTRDVCRYWGRSPLRGTFAVTRGHWPNFAVSGDVARDVCRYKGRLPLLGTFAVTRDVCRYPELLGGLIT